MHAKAATAAFAALGQEHRLAVFRMLMAEGPAGLSAGEIALRLGVPASSLSTHLATLERASLLRSWRVQRHVFYAVDVDGTREVVAFLTRDCCRGHPEICGFDPVSECAAPVTATEPTGTPQRRRREHRQEDER
ncbi:MAG: winged helix-turn-helix domain-containing protein [Pseudomonadota bacterium]